MTTNLPQIIIIPLFDLLLSEAKPIVSIFQQGLKEKGLPGDEWVLAELIGRTVPEVVSTLCQRSYNPCNEATLAEISANIRHQFNAYLGSPINSPQLKEAEHLLQVLNSKGIKIGVTSWLSQETTEIALKSANLFDRIDAFTHSDSKQAQGTLPDVIFSLMRKAGVTKADRVANLGSTKFDILRGYHAQCQWNILMAADKSNVRWNAYPSTAVVSNLQEAMAELFLKSAGPDFYKILNLRNRKNRK